MLKQRTRYHERLLEELLLKQEYKEREKSDETFEQPQFCKESDKSEIQFI